MYVSSKASGKSVPEPSLLDNTISTGISCAGKYQHKLSPLTQSLFLFNPYSVIFFVKKITVLASDTPSLQHMSTKYDGGNKISSTNRPTDI